MIDIKKVIDKREATVFLQERGIEMNLHPMFVMCAMEEGRILGVGVVSVSPEGAVIEKVVCDVEIGWLIVKALLNSLDLDGVQQVEIRDIELTSLAQMLNFKECDGVWRLELLGCFGGGCRGCAQY